MAEKAKGKAAEVKVGIKELIDQVFDASEVAATKTIKKNVDVIVRMTLDVIAKNMIKHREVGITGMFAFQPKLRAARIGRNPQDPSKTIDIPEQWTINLKVGSTLKEEMNKKK